jgi:hypothetical protein
MDVSPAVEAKYRLDSMFGTVRYRAHKKDAPEMGPAVIMAARLPRWHTDLKGSGLDARRAQGRSPPGVKYRQQTARAI